MTVTQTCAKFQQKINFVAVRAGQSFKYFRQIAWFNRALSKFRYRILYNLLVLPNYKKITS